MDRFGRSTAMPSSASPGVTVVKPVSSTRHVYEAPPLRIVRRPLQLTAKMVVVDADDWSTNETVPSAPQDT